MVIQQQPSSLSDRPQVSSMVKSRRRSVSPAEPSYRLAQALVKQEKWQEAIAAYQQALTITPNWVEVQRELGDLFLKLERWDETVDVYETAISLRSDVAEVYHNLGDALLKLQRWEDAVAAYQKAIKLNPEFSWSYNNLGDGLRELQRWDEAAQAYQKAIELKPDFALSHHNLGDILVKKEDWEGAIAAYQKAVDLDPNFVWSYYNLAEIYVKLDQWDEAVEVYRQVLKIKPDLTEVEEKLNQALHQQVKARLETALSYYLQAIKNNPTDIESYQKALEIKPDNAELYWELGKAWFHKSKYQQAIDAYQNALLIKPNLVEVEDNAITLKICRQAIKMQTDILELEKNFSQPETRIKNWQNHEILAEEKAEAWNQNEVNLKKIGIESIIGISEECVGNLIKGSIFIDKGLTESVTIALFIDHKRNSDIICNNLNKSSEKNTYSFNFTIPDEYLDGKEHQLEIKISENQLVIHRRMFILQLNGNIDIANHAEIEGWIADANSPQNSLELDVYVNGSKYESILANLQRDDVKEILGFSQPGFFVGFPAEKLRGAEIVLTLKDSCLPILNTPIIVVSQEAKTNTISLLNQHLSEFIFLTTGEKQWLTKVLFPNLKNLIRHQQENENVLFNKTYHQLSWRKQKKEVSVNVIVPVYKNLKVTQECLKMLIKSKRNRPYQIIVINDCSPEPEIHTYLDELVNAGQIKLINQAENQGFVKSVNNGMSYDTQSDVVLLNSDAYVTDYWLDDLREAVYKDDKIATGTPFSNNATIFSYPINCQETEDIPDDLTLEELAQICQRVNQDLVIDVPSGHGFCLYIRRDALIEVGDFDAETWGRGYGEEVDWCQRALDLGWRHIAVPGVFVQHVGSQSFTDDKTALINRSLQLMSEKYPEYNLVIQEFIKSDPLAAARRNIDLERLKRCGDKFILMISHNLGGGTERHIKDLVSLLEVENINSLVLKPDAKSNDWLELTCQKLDLLARYNITHDREDLINDLKYLGVFHVHIHHTIGFPNNFIENLLKELALSYDVTLHDYTSICPRVTLSQNDGKYCQDPPVEVCELCVKKYGINENLQKIYKEIDSMTKWRLNSENLLQTARKIFVPSQDMAERMSKYFPAIKFTVRYHPEVKQNVNLYSQNDYEPTVRVGLIGGISEIKGLKTLYNCANYAANIKKDIEFIVIGTTANNSLFEELPNVTIYGAYKPKELNELISQSKLDFAAFFSTWPETYCYTLSEALENGLYPFAFDIGAVSERVRQLGVGYMIEPDVKVAFLVEALYDFGVQCREQQRIIDIGNDHADSFLNEYYLLKS